MQVTAQRVPGKGTQTTVCGIYRKMSCSVWVVCTDIHISTECHKFSLAAVLGEIFLNDEQRAAALHGWSLINGKNLQRTIRIPPKIVYSRISSALWDHNMDTFTFHSLSLWELSSPMCSPGKSIYRILRMSLESERTIIDWFFSKGQILLSLVYAADETTCLSSIGVIAGWPTQTPSTKTQFNISSP